MGAPSGQRSRAPKVIASFLASPPRAVSVDQMIGVIVTLLIIWAVLAILGLVIEGLLWLAVIALLLFFATVVWGWLKRNARR